MGCGTAAQTDNSTNEMRRETSRGSQNLKHSRFIMNKVIKMYGGYNVPPKLGEALQRSQILVQAASKTPINIKITGSGKVGMMALLPQANQFPLASVTDMIQSSQIQENISEFTIDCPNPSGFILYIISEGQSCNVTIDANGKLLLDVVHGDLTEVPPPLAKIGERKKKAENATKLVMREKTWLNSYNLTMHGGYVVENEKGEHMDDTQFKVYAPTGNHVKISATGEGNLALMALRKEEAFPIETVTEGVIGYATGNGSCDLVVVSPGPEGFVVYVMSGYTLANVSIEGVGQMLLGIKFFDDHVPDGRSSASKTTKSSVLHREEFRSPVKQHTFLTKYTHKIQGGNEVDAVPGLDIMENNQLLVYSGSGAKLHAKAKGAGKVGIIAMDRDSFPLVKTTHVLGSTLNQTDSAELVVESPGPRGVAYYFIGEGNMEVEVFAEDRMLLEVAHAVTM